YDQGLKYRPIHRYICRYIGIFNCRHRYWGVRPYLPMYRRYIPDKCDIPDILPVSPIFPDTHNR
ncbi:unnamed protein product, partial [Prunus brigantina]